jgi:hypothetical protein
MSILSNLPQNVATYLDPNARLDSKSLREALNTSSTIKKAQEAEEKAEECGKELRGQAYDWSKTLYAGEQKAKTARIAAGAKAKTSAAKAKEDWGDLKQPPRHVLIDGIPYLIQEKNNGEVISTQPFIASAAQQAGLVETPVFEQYKESVVPYVAGGGVGIAAPATPVVQSATAAPEKEFAPKPAGEVVSGGEKKSVLDLIEGAKIKRGTLGHSPTLSFETPDAESSGKPIGTVLEERPGWKYVVQKQTSAGKPTAVWVPERDRYGNVTRIAEGTAKKETYLNELIKGQTKASEVDSKYNADKAELVRIEEVLDKMRVEQGVGIIMASDLMRGGYAESALKALNIPVKGEIAHRTILDAKRKLQDKYYPQSKGTKERVSGKLGEEKAAAPFIPKKMSKEGTTEAGRKNADSAIKNGVTFEQFEEKVNLNEQDYESYKKYWQSKGGKFKSKKK